MQPMNPWAIDLVKLAHIQAALIIEFDNYYNHERKLDEGILDRLQYCVLEYEKLKQGVLVSGRWVSFRQEQKARALRR